MFHFGRNSYGLNNVISCNANLAGSEISHEWQLHFHGSCPGGIFRERSCFHRSWHWKPNFGRKRNFRTKWKLFRGKMLLEISTFCKGDYFHLLTFISCGYALFHLFCITFCALCSSVLYYSVLFCSVFWVVLFFVLSCHTLDSLFTDDDYRACKVFLFIFDQNLEVP